jgi:protein-tyrosine kinase
LLEQALLTTPVPNLRVLPSGSVPPNPADLLGSQSIQKVLDHLRQLAEIVIIDSPPVLPVADTTLLATGKMPVILVVQSGKTRASAARRALESLRRTDALPIRASKVDEH